jgi:hypothetical protein
MLLIFLLNCLKCIQRGKISKNMAVKFTKSAYYQRLAAYVLAAMLTQYIGDAEVLRSADAVTASVVAAKVLLAGVIVWRAFVDQTKTLVDECKSHESSNR